eukprot:CAMPEP_0168584740 /NCGR_PEP_ID=MMETSP0420-20121227/3307_1 /TAXON_ID=498008 /ORGANISM="Pessonella sp." /LENGTH=722 /DNA_ID=CAMNT_0008619575 /DNA_START=167 /DNA_END=2335 /DNA_ORIENTATION=+
MAGGECCGVCNMNCPTYSCKDACEKDPNMIWIANDPMQPTDPNDPSDPNRPMATNGRKRCSPPNCQALGECRPRNPCPHLQSCQQQCESNPAKMWVPRQMNGGDPNTDPNTNPNEMPPPNEQPMAMAGRKRCSPVYCGEEVGQCVDRMPPCGPFPTCQETCEKDPNMRWIPNTDPNNPNDPQPMVEPDPNTPERQVRKRCSPPAPCTAEQGQCVPREPCAGVKSCAEQCAEKGGEWRENRMEPTDPNGEPTDPNRDPTDPNEVPEMRAGRKRCSPPYCGPEAGYCHLPCGPFPSCREACEGTAEQPTGKRWIPESHTDPMVEPMRGDDPSDPNQVPEMRAGRKRCSPPACAGRCVESNCAPCPREERQCPAGYVSVVVNQPDPASCDCPQYECVQMGQCPPCSEEQPDDVECPAGTEWGFFGNADEPPRDGDVEMRAEPNSGNVKRLSCQPCAYGCIEAEPSRCEEIQQQRDTCRNEGDTWVVYEDVNMDDPENPDEMVEKPDEMADPNIPPEMGKYRKRESPDRCAAGTCCPSCDNACDENERFEADEDDAMGDTRQRRVNVCPACNSRPGRCVPVDPANPCENIVCRTNADQCLERGGEPSQANSCGCVKCAFNFDANADGDIDLDTITRDLSSNLQGYEVSVRRTGDRLKITVTSSETTDDNGTELSDSGELAAKVDSSSSSISNVQVSQQAVVSEPADSASALSMSVGLIVVALLNTF